MDPDRIQGTIKNATGHGQSALGELTGSTRMQTEGLANQATGAAQNAYGRAKDAARDALDHAPEAWNQAVDVGQDYAHRGADVVRDRMNEQPLAALMLAGVIGYLLGWAIHGRG